MPTHTGSGFSECTDSFQAGAEAAAAALAQAGVSACALAILMTTSRHNPHQFLAGVRAVLGPQTQVLGSYAVGVITNTCLGYDGYQCGVAVVASDTIRVNLFLEEHLANNEYACGHALAQQVLGQAYDSPPNLLFFYDSVNRTTGRFRMNMGTPLLAGMSDALGGQWPAAAGAGTMGDMQFRESFQWFNDRILSCSATALVLSGGGVRLHQVIMHGCRPASAYHTVTKAEGPIILEIDHRPATELLADLVGGDSGLTFEDYGWFITLGVNKGDKWGPFREQDYANRMCVGVDRKRNALVMVEPDLVEGSEIQLMRRAFDFEYIYTETRNLLAAIAADGRRPLLAFYIDCAGRAGAYSGNDQEEAREVQKALGTIPLLGFYSGVEIAQLPSGNVVPLDWTGVLCIWSEVV
ncbi:FIST signal transduction protein [Hymenobacter mucosus]|uniref:Uncharacterized conserved protein, contains FIST_N domain n=1 Tax=Hymenobacter mucosus TaxID=1411120 RepID=A0A239AKR5_9BACT|nr:FIST N-terminal domain-containing protein [Hymenobacter mucosus]SNR95664.1 Uncharacterized conserved protein, contains FIST_N domain [Hymenobacter mucosus]